MIDQAVELRKLVQRAAECAAGDFGPAPRLLVLSGAQAGAGTTTLAVHLALCLAQSHPRPVLVDADLFHADVASRCRCPVRESIADVLSGRRDLATALQPGPAGIQVLPGPRPPAQSADYNAGAQQRLLRQLRQLGKATAFVVLDAGSSGREASRRFWQAADDILLIATSDAASLVNAYATVKHLAADSVHAPIRLVVNRVADAKLAEDIHQRLASSCRRFLGRQVELLGTVPVEDSWSRAEPDLPSSPRGLGPQAVTQLAQRLLTEHPRVVAVHPTGTRRSPYQIEVENFAKPDARTTPIKCQSTVIPHEVKLERLQKL